VLLTGLNEVGLGVPHGGEPTQVAPRRHRPPLRPVSTTRWHGENRSRFHVPMAPLRPQRPERPTHPEARLGLSINDRACEVADEPVHLSTRVIFGGAALGSASQETADGVLEVRSRVRRQPPRHRRQLRRLRAAGSRPGWRATVTITSSRPRQASGNVGCGAGRARALALASRRGPRGPSSSYTTSWTGEEDWAAAHAPDGALAGAVRAREEGLVRFIGVTGHGVSIPADAPA